MTKKNERIVALTTLLAGQVAVEALRVGVFKRGIRKVTGHDLSWTQVMWIVSMLRAAGGLFEEGRKAAVDHSENAQRVKDKYGV